MKSRELDSKAETKARLSRQPAAEHQQIAEHPLLRLQRKYGNRYVQRVLALSKKADGGTEAAPEVEQAIQRARGGGQALNSGVRAQMESAFGADFSGVRVHTDSEADTLNRALNARAFTTGQDIFFRQGAYNPGGSSGRELLAHELTHVVQQADGTRPRLTVGQPGDRYEQEADRVARAVMQRYQQVTQRVKGDEVVRRQVEEEEEPIQAEAKDAWVQRQMEEEEEEPIQTKVEDVQVQRQAEEEEEEEPILAKAKDTGVQRRVTGQGQGLLQRRRRRRRYAWRWSSSVQGRNRQVSDRVEVEDYTQRFLGLFMPARAMLSYRASATHYRTGTAVEVTTQGNAIFKHFESFGRFIARGWRTRRAEMSDARRLELDPRSGSITLGVPTKGTAAGATPERDGPLSITSRVTNTQVQSVNENQKKLVVTAKVHVNVGGSITESATGGAELGVGGGFGPEGARVSPEASVNLGGSWSITHNGGERYRLIDATPTFVFIAIRKRVSVGD